ncbi:MAG: hypothetical protein ACK4VZ_15895 [Paracoccaceae bacterium]
MSSGLDAMERGGENLVRNLLTAVSIYSVDIFGLHLGFVVSDHGCEIISGQGWRVR